MKNRDLKDKLKYSIKDMVRPTRYKQVNDNHIKGN